MSTIMEQMPVVFQALNVGFVQTLKSVKRTPILPSEDEIKTNPRSRSAKLRVAERV